jgi:hypothetical protein
MNAGRYTLQKAVQICQNALWSDPLQHGEAIVPLMEGHPSRRRRGPGENFGPADDPRDCGDADERGADGKRNADRA